MRKVLLIFGTRPEAIKIAPLIKRLEERPDKFESVVCVTAQHRRLLDDVLETFGIRTDYDLDIMEDDQSPFDVTAKVLLELKVVLAKEKPDIVLVQGDTTTTFAATLASFYNKIPVGHIEAGLRTDDKYMPFPEEVNRRLTSAISEIHFAPTEKARNNLLKEGVEAGKIFVTGNTVIDALNWVLENKKTEDRELKKKLLFLDNGNKIILVTAHRRESFGKPLENICYALKKISEDNKQVEIVYPLHPNPNVQSTVKAILGRLSRIHLIEPLSYVDFSILMDKAYLILTDSGGIQEEAPSLGKPVLVMRERTERQEAVSQGTAVLVGTDSKRIYTHTKMLLDDREEYSKMTSAKNPFGDGTASKKIVDIIENKWGDL